MRGKKALLPSFQHSFGPQPPPAPPPLFVSVPATDLPLNVFTFSSFDCSQSALFYFTRESEIPGFSPSQAELNTAPTGPGDGGEGGCKKETQIPGIPNALLFQTITLEFSFKGARGADITNYT